MSPSHRSTRTNRATASRNPAQEPPLGGLSADDFMRRYWQKKPLLVRNAFAIDVAPVSRAALFALARRDDIESRLIRRPAPGSASWSVEHGPFRHGTLPGVRVPNWTLLVQGVNLHVPAAHALLSRFRFVPDARLDDLMISWASAGGGVGPHFDSYDVFLIQATGQRRWRIGRMPGARLQADQPIKLIEGFQHEHEWLLGPGDMLYLPPGWAHDGDAIGGDCMTCSVGFRAPRTLELSREILLRLADAQDDAQEDLSDAEGQTPAGPTGLYRDPGQGATAQPAAIPAGLTAFARKGLAAVLNEPAALERALGEFLSEPKSRVRFTAGEGLRPGSSVRLNAKSCMLYDDRHVFLNGEALAASGRDAQVLRQLADKRHLSAAVVRRGSVALREVLSDWCEAGWLDQGAS